MSGTPPATDFRRATLFAMDYPNAVLNMLLSGEKTVSRAADRVYRVHVLSNATADLTWKFTNGSYPGASRARLA